MNKCYYCADCFAGCPECRKPALTVELPKIAPSASPKTEIHPPEQCEISGDYFPGTSDQAFWFKDLSDQRQELPQ